MADSNDSGPSIAGNGLVWLIAVATGTWFLTAHEPPLRDSRPNTEESQRYEGGGPQDVAARLWQDPISVVRKASETETQQLDTQLRRSAEQALVQLAAGSTTAAAAGSSLAPPTSTEGACGHTCSPIVGRQDLRGDEPLLVLGVTVPGSYYEEAIEARRRYRYAVLAALNVRNYVPVDEQHLGYFRPNPDAFPEPIPFEWFKRQADGSNILVLWLDEDGLMRPAGEDRSSDPICKLALLRNALKDPSRAKLRMKFKIIGPSDSQMLRAMVTTRRDEPRPPCDTPEQGIEFFDYGATVPDARLMGSDKATDLATYFRNRGLSFHRVISTDDKLAQSLVQELRHRGICQERQTGERWTCPDHIAIVSEWDTLYGQSWPPTMRKAFCPNCSATGTDGLLSYSYLRGLDGRLPSSGPAQDSKSPGLEQVRDEQAGKRDNGSSGDTASRLERPEGQGQFDYLRRLAARIKDRDAQLRQSGKRPIAAIGVLGSDVYDKLLVLQALRPEFPTATFFTTDLDARLWDPIELRATRNLIIASSYDVRLRSRIQGDIPPFRDEYQSAAFLAAWLATEDVMADCENCDAADFDWQHAPRIFQIGRTAAIPLASDAFAAAENAAAKCDKGSGCRRVQPEASVLFPQLEAGALPFLGASFIVTGLLLGLGAAFYHVLPNSWRASPRRSAVHWIALAGGAFVLAAAGVAAWPSLAAWLTGYGAGEPMFFTEGISIWPTVLLRLLSLVLGVWLILYCLKRLDENIEDIARTLRLDDLRRKIAAEPSPGWWPRLQNMFSLHTPPAAPNPAMTADEAEVASFWRAHFYSGRTGARFGRAAACVIGMFGVWAILSCLFSDPNVPAREGPMRTVYAGVTALDVFCTLFLIFLVADASLFSCLSVREMRQKVHRGSIWPKRSLDYFQKRLKLEGRPVGDWIALNFVALRSKCIMNLIYLPFGLIALLIISRSSVFDNFAANPKIVISQVFSLLVLIGCVVWLREEAKCTRDVALEDLGDLETGLPGIAPEVDETELWSMPPSNEQRLSALGELRRNIEALQDGAFLPISHQPMVRAFILPLGTYGGTALLDYLSSLGT